MKRVYAREEVCMGCGLCEVYCIAAHSRNRDNVIKAYKKEKPRPVSRIIVERETPISFGLQCRHCENAECISACIAGAMQRERETGIVKNDPERCVGCWTCILACPFGVIVRDENGKKAASKCDLCSQSGDLPACVKNCPIVSLVFD